MLDKNHIAGTATELRACLWLMDQGYMVFRNVCSYGPIDIVAIKDNETIRLDAKSSWPYLTPKQLALGVGAITPDKKGGFIIRKDFSHKHKGKRGRPPGAKNKNPIDTSTSSVFSQQTKLMRVFGFLPKNLPATRQ